MAAASIVGPLVTSEGVLSATAANGMKRMSSLHGLSGAEKKRRGQQDLILGMAPAIVADRYGVTRGTVSGWHTPEVHAEREKLRAETVASARAELAADTQAAMAALREVAADPGQPGPARVAAANSILDRAGVSKSDEITVKSEQSSADEVNAGLIAILGRAARELGRSKVDLSPPVTEAEADEG